MKHFIFRLLAWSALLAIAFVTLGPARPELLASADLERVTAWAIAGALFIAAYPARAPIVLGLLIAAAGLLELLQLESFGRHGRMLDFGYKSLGACCGVLLAYILLGSRARSEG